MSRRQETEAERGREAAPRDLSPLLLPPPKEVATNREPLVGRGGAHLGTGAGGVVLALGVESGHLALLPAPPPGTCCKFFPSTQVSRGPPHASAVLVGNQTPGIPPSSGSQPRGQTDWGLFPGWYKSARTPWGHLRMGGGGVQSSHS